MDPSQVFRRNPDVSFQNLMDQVVVVDARTREVHVLNATAARIWNLLETDSTLGALMNELAREFDFEAVGAVEDEVEAFLKELVEKGLTVRQA